MDCLSWSQLAFLYNKIVRGTCFDISGFALTLANTISWSERPGMIVCYIFHEGRVCCEK